MSVLAGESPENSPRDSKLCNDDLVKARDSLFAFMDQMDIRDSVKLEDLEDDSGDSDDSVRTSQILGNQAFQFLRVLNR